MFASPRTRTAAGRSASITSVIPLFSDGELLGVVARAHFQVVVGPAEPHVEDLLRGELGIVVLAGVDDDLVDMRLERVSEWGSLNELRARADHRQDLVPRSGGMPLPSPTADAEDAPPRQRLSLVPPQIPLPLSRLIEHHPHGARIQRMRHLTIRVDQLPKTGPWCASIPSARTVPQHFGQPARRPRATLPGAVYVGGGGAASVPR